MSKTVNLERVRQARLKIERLRAQDGYCRPCYDDLFDGVEDGFYTWTEIGITPESLARLAMLYIVDAFEQEDHEWLISDLARMARVSREAELRRRSNLQFLQRTA